MANSFRRVGKIACCVVTFRAVVSDFAHAFFSSAPIRVGTALHRSYAEGRVRGPRLCPPYATIRHSLLAPSRSRDALRPGFATFLHPTPRGGGAPRWRSGAAAPAACRSASKTRVNALLRGTPRRLRGALRPSSEGRAPLGAPPWRFWAGGRASGLRHCLRIRRASSSQPGRSAWRAGSP